MNHENARFLKWAHFFKGASLATTLAPPHHNPITLAVYIHFQSQNSIIFYATMAIGGKTEESERDKAAIKNATTTMIELAVQVISKGSFPIFFSSDFSWEFSEEPI